MQVEDIRARVDADERPFVAAATVIGAMVDGMIARYGAAPAITLLEAITADLKRREPTHAPTEL